MARLTLVLPGGTAASSGSWSTDSAETTPKVKQEPLGLAGKSSAATLARHIQSKQGQEEPSIHLLQSGWCRYVGQTVSQPCNVWVANLSKDAAEQAHQHQSQQEQQQQPCQQPQKPDRSHVYDLLEQAQLQTAATSHHAQPPQHPFSAVSAHDSALLPPGVEANWTSVHRQPRQLLSEQSAQELAELLGIHSTDEFPGAHLGTAALTDGVGSWQHQQAGGDLEQWLKPSSRLQQPSSTNNLIMSSRSTEPMSRKPGGPPTDEDPTLYSCQGHLPYDGLQHCIGNAAMQPQQAAAPSFADQYWPQDHNVMHNRPEPLSGSIYMPDPEHKACHQLGGGQFAMETAVGTSYLHPTTTQQLAAPVKAPDWLAAMQLNNARGVRPYTQHPPDLLQPSQLPITNNHHYHHPSADLDASGRSNSEDMTRYSSLGAFSNRTGSGGLAVSQQDVLGHAMASPQSSLSSSLPSMSPHLPVAQGGLTGREGRSMPTASAAPQPVLNRLLIQLVTAPAIFSVPICPGKLLNPPFRVRVAVLAEAQVKLQLTLKAYVLSKDHINSLEQWQPTQHVTAESLDGAEVQQVIECTQPGFGNADDPADLLGGTSDFVFSELKFKHSSRMKPRWLLFAATLPSHDIMYVLYNVPTIIMSRACDQLEKAMGTLKGAEQGAVNKKRLRNSSPARLGLTSNDDAAARSPSVPSASNTAQEEEDGLEWPSTGPFTYQRWHRMVEKKYNALTLVRALSPEDVEMMEKVAGFHDQSSARKPSFDLDERQWAFFGVWYLSYLKIFRCHQQLWVMEAPTAICGFGVDRLKAEHVLADQPLGTFLVRPGLSLASCMVISAVIEGSIIKHMALDGSRLEAKSLEAWVRSVQEAQELLDYRTGQRYTKAQVFSLHYQRFAAAASDSKRQHP